MKLIIIDTNVLLAIASHKLDIFEAIEDSCVFSYQLAIVEGTLRELKKIQLEQRGKDKFAAKLAQQIVLKRIDEKIVDVIQDDSSKSVDDNLVEYSKDGALVLTQDKELKGRLTPPYLTLRQMNRVILVE